jgi:RND family efflux transporter MFP subunit
MKALLRSRWFYAALFVVLGATAVKLYAGKTDEAPETAMVGRVVRGDFKVKVTTAGDLRAKSSVPIAPPQNTCMVGACQMKVASIIPEGTIVKQGDVVAELDRAPIITYTNNTNLAMQKAQAVFEQAQLDTTLNLSKAREDLRNLGTALEERTIAKEQALYEAPSVKRQAELDYLKAERALAQAQSDYKTRENQAKAKMREVSTDLQRNNNQLEMIKAITASFTVTAPAAGMLIYTRDYQGKKRGAGSMMYSGEAALAELPDLTKMLSTTYVNEVDIRKVSVGQPVALTLDSDPLKKLTGTIVGIANVGEERPNSDAKVFEVKIEIAETDTTLRPGMTTSNAIEVYSEKNVLSVPLEAVTADGDASFVFKKSGGTVVKQEVETGALNDTHIVVTKGVEEGDEVLLVPPANVAQVQVNRLEGKVASPNDAPSAKTVPMAPTGQTSKPNSPSVKPAPPAKAAPPKESGRGQ